MTGEEVAALLDVSSRTVARDWRFARAWLRHQLTGCRNASREAGSDDSLRTTRREPPARPDRD